MNNAARFPHHLFRADFRPQLSVIIVNWNTWDLLLKILGQLFEGFVNAVEVESATDIFGPRITGEHCWVSIYATALTHLLNPFYVNQLARRERQVPQL